MLVVFQKYVVLGRVLANQVRLKNQRLLLAFGNDPFDIANVGKHERCRAVSVVLGAVEVAAHAVL